MKAVFIERYSAEKLFKADYNPRAIQPEKLELLKKSITHFGLIKPLILNGENGILTAGHQRITAIKALGIKEVPVIQMEGISRQDEIRFNLYHNSIETNASKVRLTGPLRLGYNIVPSDEIVIIGRGKTVVLNEIGNLIIKYGEWGSVICDEDGNVLYNADYAVSCKLLRRELLCFVISSKDVEALDRYLTVDFGEYYYENLGVRSCNQLYCQLHRSINGEVVKRQNRSTTYDRHVLPRINRDMRILDFGAGECAYARRLQADGFKILAYEPNYRNQNNNVDIRQVVRFIRDIEKDVRENGLFDMVVLDSVLNSVISPKVEHDVIVACAAFLKPDGVLVLGTRNLGSVLSHARAGHATGKKRYLEFLDKDNFCATWRAGVWTMQHFHSGETLETLLRAYFDAVEIIATETGSNIYAVACKKKYLDPERLRDALECELNFEYTNGFQHNRHGPLLEQVMTLNT